MAIQITGWSTALLKLAVHLAVAAYRDNWNEFNGEMIYANKTGGFLRPVFYVYKLNNALWIINRGSITVEDYLSCAEFNETTTEYGTFHLGAYEAAQYTLEQVKQYIADFNGPIYFTGHSYGGTVAPVLAAICMQMFPEKDIGVFAFAPLPMMDDATSAKFKDHMVSIVNHRDLIPTLSVGNLYERISLLVPLIKNVDVPTLNKHLKAILDLFSSEMSSEIYDEVLRDLPEITNAIFGYAQGEKRLVRYPCGHVFQINKSDPKKIEECEIEVTLELNNLSIYPWAMSEHPDLRYKEAVDAIPE